MSQEVPQNGQRIDRMPPQAIEVERSVLGAMFLDARAIGRAIELLDGDCFYDHRHSKIFEAILTLYERNEAVDPLTVGEELRRRGVLEQVGDEIYLANLVGGVSTGANIDHHARIVLDKALGRRLIETANSAIEQAYAGSEDVYELIDRAEQSIFSLSERRLSQGFVKLDAVLDETIEQVERAHNQVSTVTGVDTGFTDLNELTSGFQNGDLIILAARPSVGKTALALALARNAAVEGGVGVAMFSLEMSNLQLAQRLLCLETKLNLHSLRTGRLRDDDWMHLARHVERMAQMPIYIDDTPGVTVLEARAKTRRLQREHGLGMVVIDYMQLMSSHERVNSREQEISQISRGLKGMAKELNVPVLVLSQLNRAVENRSDRRPQLSDLRESGSIEQDADVVMFIYRPDLYGLSDQEGGSLENVAEIVVAKQRNGPTDSVQLSWNSESATFETMAPEWRNEPSGEEGFSDAP
ncbi:MAG: replicative DNA helicase [Candidatus Latescibacteria bacterium]|nr:replicative DNA helicase [Candidatus Latescibacterota bacterium]